MTLRINDDANIGIDEKFCLYLEKKMLEYVVELINSPNRDIITRLQLIEDYINSDIPKIKNKNYSKKKISIREIVIQGCLNLRYYKSFNSYFIQIDPDKILYGTFIKIIDLCSLIDQGTFDIPGTLLFTRLFEHFEENMGEYLYNFYTVRGGKL